MACHRRRCIHDSTTGGIPQPTVTRPPAYSALEHPTVLYQPMFRIPQHFRNLFGVPALPRHYASHHRSTVRSSGDPSGFLSAVSASVTSPVLRLLRRCICSTACVCVCGAGRLAAMEAVTNPKYYGHPPEQFTMMLAKARRPRVGGSSEMGAAKGWHTNPVRPGQDSSAITAALAQE